MFESITLRIDKCEARSSYRVTFEGRNAESMALTFLAARTSTHAFSEIEYSPVSPLYAKLLAYLYPACEHGLSLSNCCGPQHYYFDEEEQARGYRNS